MTNKVLNFACTETPLPSVEWRLLSDTERQTRVKDVLRTGSFKGAVVIIAAKEDGQIIVDLVKPMSASERGTLLLDLEEFLKGRIDHGLVVWLASLGDRNSLRNLRGIEVKS